MDDVRDRLEDILRRVFRPERLEVVDFSAAHAGHDGARPGGQTHFRVEIVAAAFAGQNRLARQRLVMEAAAELLHGEIHALTVRAVAPGESGGP